MYDAHAWYYFGDGGKRGSGDPDVRLVEEFEQRLRKQFSSSGGASNNGDYPRDVIIRPEMFRDGTYMLTQIRYLCAFGIYTRSDAVRVVNALKAARNESDMQRVAYLINLFDGYFGIFWKLDVNCNRMTFNN
jgi:hypothetical protein